jgi:hypothetical protein
MINARMNTFLIRDRFYLGRLIMIMISEHCGVCKNRNLERRKALQ